MARMPSLRAADAVLVRANAVADTKTSRDAVAATAAGSAPTAEPAIRTCLPNQRCTVTIGGSCVIIHADLFPTADYETCVGRVAYWLDKVADARSIGNLRLANSYVAQVNAWARLAERKRP